MWVSPMFGPSVSDDDIQRMEWKSSSSSSSSSTAVAAAAVVVTPVGAVKDLVIRIPAHRTVWDRAGLEDKVEGMWDQLVAMVTGEEGEGSYSTAWWDVVCAFVEERAASGSTGSRVRRSEFSALATRVSYGLGWGDLTPNEQALLDQVVDAKWNSCGDLLAGAVGDAGMVPWVRDFVLPMAVAESIMTTAYPTLSPAVSMVTNSWLPRTYSPSSNADEGVGVVWNSTRTPLTPHQARHAVYALRSPIDDALNTAVSREGSTRPRPPHRLWPIEPPSSRDDLRTNMVSAAKTLGGFGDVRHEEFEVVWRVCGELFGSDPRRESLSRKGKDRWDWVVYGVIPQMVMTWVVSRSYPTRLESVGGRVKDLMEPIRWQRVVGPVDEVGIPEREDEDEEEDEEERTMRRMECGTERQGRRVESGRSKSTGKRKGSPPRRSTRPRRKSQKLLR